MIVDTSALVAVVARERDVRRVIDELERAIASKISTVTLLGLRIVLAHDRFGAADLVDDLLHRYRIQPLDFTVEHANAAARAYQRYGRGHHTAARLNFGDCASYAAYRKLPPSHCFTWDTTSRRPTLLQRCDDQLGSQSLRPCDRFGRALRRCSEGAP